MTKTIEAERGHLDTTTRRPRGRNDLIRRMRVGDQAKSLQEAAKTCLCPDSSSLRYARQRNMMTLQVALGGTSMPDDIRYEAHGPVRIITLNRPDKMNSLDFAANEALVEAWREFDRDADARVAVITGSGKRAFCAGADLKTYTMAFATRPGPEFRRRYTNREGFGGITRHLDIWKPIIAAINGYAISGGLELALACDIRFAAPNAEFALQDVKWGFHACDGALVRLPWIVGLGHAMEIFLSGERFDARYALRVGLVNRIIPQKRLLAETLTYAERLATRAPLAQQLGKEVLLRSLGRTIEDGLRLESRSFHDLAFTKDLREGTQSFRKGRPARFRGK